MSDVFGLYDATINLNSRRENQVRKTGITAPELAILKAIHSLPNEFNGGHPPIIDIKRTGDALDENGNPITEADLRVILGGADGDLPDGRLPTFTRAKFQMAFPNEHIPLPREVPGFEELKNHPASLANLKPVGRPKKETGAEVLEG